MHSSPGTLRDHVRRALAEDLGNEALAVDADVTTRLSVPAGTQGRARLIAKSAGVLAGMACAVEAFAAMDPKALYETLLSDGQAFRPGDVLLQIVGGMQPLLAAERTALNYLQRLSGIATLTRAHVDAVAGTRAVILDTRKTTPGMRHLEKAAVLAGGGQNHRIGLFDQVLLKENHFAFARPLPYEEVVRRCVAGQPDPVVAEATTLEEAVLAVRGGASVVLLDNFAPGPSLTAAVAAVRAEATARRTTVLTEASGGVNLRNVAAFARCGVDRISIGALTHSAPAADLSLLVEGIA